MLHGILWLILNNNVTKSVTSMARKIWLVIRTGMFVSFLIGLWNFFWVLRLQQTQVPSNIFSSPSSSVPKITNIEDLDVAMEEFNPKQPIQKSQEIRIAAVVCGNRVNETLVMIKSAVIMSSCIIKFILFADVAATVMLNRTVITWPENIVKRIKMDLRPITFPADKAEEWKKLFKPCASQRLFLPVNHI